MDNNKLIRLLSQIIQHICDSGKLLNFKDGKIKFRQYYRIENNDYQLRPIDITIEFEMKPKKKTALQKARTQLKKAEHVKTPLSIKRKLKTKKEKKS